MTPEDRGRYVDELKAQMEAAVKDLEFERAAELRDEIKAVTGVSGSNE
jgi:excinuclease UvrABC nuclease subunit